jgi:hypothetical protein
MLSTIKASFALIVGFKCFREKGIFRFHRNSSYCFGRESNSWRLSWIELNPGTNTGRYREMMNNRESAALQEEKK